MRIDNTHRQWAVVSVVVTVLSFLVYFIGQRFYYGNFGHTPLGITLGVIGFGMMIFAGLLSVRKRFRIARIGRTQFWMRGHLWLGLIAYPVILFHAGLSFGRGSLTFSLMVLFTVVILSGLFGAVLQHYVPRMMTGQVGMETIYDEIPRVCGQLETEAHHIVDELCGAVVAKGAIEAAGGGAAVVTVLDLDVDAKKEMDEFYQQQMLPYLRTLGGKGCQLTDPMRAKAMFVNLKMLMPEEAHPGVDDLENICDEKRQLDRQAKMHRWLHGWLLVHLPISYALLILGLIHAIGALRY